MPPKGWSLTKFQETSQIGRHHIAIACGYLIIGFGSDDGHIDGEKD
jgi:hypothetical protein